VGDRGTPRDVKALGLEDWRGFRGTSRSSPIMTNVVRELVGGGNEPEERRGVPPVLERRLG